MIMGLMERFLLVSLQASFPYGEALIEALDPVRKEKALRYVKEEDQLRSALAGLLIRRYVGKGEILFGPHGKPYIPGRPFFSVSHGGDYVGILVSDEREVGFDVEAVERCSLSIALAALTPDERKSVHDKESFALAWTLKEAIAKCSGEGIVSPREVGVIPMGDNFYSYQGKKYCCDGYVHDGHAFALARMDQTGPFPKVELLMPTDLLK